MVDQAKEQVSVPSSSGALAMGLEKLVLAVIANHKSAAGSAAVEVSLDVQAAIQDLAPALSQIGALGAEVKAQPIGVAEAFAIAGFAVAKSLAGEPADA